MVDCFLCQKQLKSFGYSEHLEKQHRVIFGVKDIKKASKKYESVPSTSNTEPGHENEEAEPDTIRSDADTVKELIEMKYLPKKKIRLRSHTPRLFQRNYQVLFEEVDVYVIFQVLLVLVVFFLFFSILIKDKSFAERM